MNRAIVQSQEIVLLLGAAPVSEAVFTESRAFCGPVVAADGAAKRALEFGVMPMAVMGDLDSLDAETLARLPEGCVHKIAEQNSTDFDKALRSIAAPLVLALGFTGQRLDHELAVYNALVRHAGRPAIVVGSDDICFHTPSELVLDLEAGTRVSLFPMAAVTGRSEGLRWPIEGLRFAPDGRVGTSNQSLVGMVRLEFDAPGMLVILPRAQLRPAIAALLAG